jgi:hypothetical protein
MTLFSTGQPGQHPHNIRGYDHYSTPPAAVKALLDAVDDFNSSTRFWEFAAGNGPIVKVLRERGFPVIASDIVRRDFPLHFTADFLSLTEAPAGCTVAITNPPFKQGRQFAEHALRLLPDVYFLLRLAFYETVCRTELLEHSGLRRVFVFRSRLPRMHREDWTGKRTSSSIAFAWFHWQRGYCGPTTLHRI